MSSREYWSARAGRERTVSSTINDVYRALTLTVNEMLGRDYFQEWFGYYCVDVGYVRGRAGYDIGPHIELALGYRDAWPLSEYDPWEGLDATDEDSGPVEVPGAVAEAVRQGFEDRTFDLIEYLHDHISEGDEDSGRYHSWSDCGWHFTQFDPEPARELLRERLARVLESYGDGYTLTTEGRIEHLAPSGLAELVATPVLTEDAEIRARVEAAIQTYRSRARTTEDLRSAVRNLFDVLEKLRPRVKTAMLKADERDLFMMANTYSIRHMKEDQRREYGPEWLSWMFYVTLATVHLITQLPDEIRSPES